VSAALHVSFFEEDFESITDASRIVSAIGLSLFFCMTPKRVAKEDPLHIAALVTTLTLSIYVGEDLASQILRKRFPRNYSGWLF
jgi:hypothetical protein